MKVAPHIAKWSGSARKRLYRALPLIGSLVAMYGFLGIDNTKASLIVGILGILIGPVAGGEIAASQVDQPHRHEVTSP